MTIMVPHSHLCPHPHLNQVQWLLWLRRCFGGGLDILEQRATIPPCKWYRAAAASASNAESYIAEKNLAAAGALA